MTTEFGQEIKRLREAKGWSEFTAARHIFGDPTEWHEVTSLEKGLAPSMSDVLHCAAAFGPEHLAHLLRLSGCALPDGLALVEEPHLTAHWSTDPAVASPRNMHEVIARQEQQP